MKLAAYIALKGNSATRLAAEVGVSVSTITRLSQGSRRPSIALIEDIERATAGQVAARDFFSAEKAPAPTPAEVAA